MTMPPEVRTLSHGLLVLSYSLFLRQSETYDEQEWVSGTREQERATAR